MRTLIIGDIHGHVNALEQLLQLANYDAASDRIICIGDYVDGWPFSYEVVEKLLELKAKALHPPVFLKGNHDQWFHEVLSLGMDFFKNRAFVQEAYSVWYSQQGKSTYNAYLRQSDEDILRHKIEFFDTLQDYFIEDNTLFVHAGFNLKLGFESTLKMDRHALLWDRSLYHEALQYWNIAENLTSMQKAVPNQKIGTFDRIYIGHTQTSFHGLTTPRLMANVVNVDQGCKDSGILTAWVMETDSFFQFTASKSQ